MMTATEVPGLDLDAAGLAHLYIGGVEPDVGPIAFQRPVEEGLHLVVDLAAQPGYLALGNAGHSHGLRGLAGRPARYIRAALDAVVVS